MKRTKRIWNKYLFKVGNKTVHGGRTTGLKRRENEHKLIWPNGHILKVGYRSTKEGAIKWEKEHGYS